MYPDWVFRAELAHRHVFDHALTQRASRMFIGHGSAPCVVVIGLKHPYLNTGQTLAANLSIPLNPATPYLPR